MKKALTLKITKAADDLLLSFQRPSLPFQRRLESIFLLGIRGRQTSRMSRAQSRGLPQ